MVGQKKPAKGKKIPKGKKVAPTPAALIDAAGGSSAKKAQKEEKERVVNPLFEKRPRNTSKPKRDWAKRDLTRFTKWPRYITLQRQKALLLQRLKVPPPVYQFNKRQTLDSHQAREVLALLNKYKPETKLAAKLRLKKQAEEQAAGKDVISKKKPLVVQQGINKVTTLVEQKKAKLVVIAHDVDPIEIVLFLPALCRKMGVPYCILKSKARLGTVVRRKTCTAVALTEVESADKNNLAKLIDVIKSHYNDRFDDIRRSWGGGALSRKALARKQKLEKAKAKETKKAEKAALLA
ncbi:60S ribosomal protein L7a isoform X1 [Hyalella azteca]|uniref:60S ribosomal protein L7a n=1 Tax=Hyalella azteca TaxID=294128 RepID=A0A8B7N7C6_HYAAZ|nr:60S ribosomal protein L7a isoform X2 [Hyalella azteca]XP_018009747.1 60S ribosomal protein L7a isoform X1 [Hyalella azteca]